MRTYTHRVAGEETTIKYVEDRDDLQEFQEWTRRPHELVSGDTEGTGLDTFSPGFGLRTVQLGTATEAYVLPVELSRDIADAARRALLELPRLAFHNLAFDALVLDRHLRVPARELFSKTTDTRILAHLLDPRQAQEGGVGHSLKQLCALWVDEHSPDTQQGLNAVFRSIGHTKETGWAAIDIDHPTYVTYAGLDVILTTRLANVLLPQIEDRGFSRLATFEHEVARVCSEMEKTGFLVDTDYSRQLSDELGAEAEEQTTRAKGYGVENLNSTKQVASALLAMGEELTETTASGALSVDKSVLLRLADLNPKWKPLGTRNPNPLADAVLRAKRASKWKTAYADAIGNLMDEDNRLHPKINALQARTGRMSITRPPLQQLPSGDGRIRRALIAEPGHQVASVDFSAVEMRILAGLAKDKTMMEAINEGKDLHSFTAEMVYGPDFTDYHRKVSKSIGFGKVYGGGADSIAKMTGAPLEDVKRAIAAYDRTYKGIKRYSKRLQQRGEWGSRAVTTPTGRELPLDRDRLYAATNYVVQSTARDVFAQCLLDLDAAGLTSYMRLPVHDEVVFVAPDAGVMDLCEEVQKHMTLPDFFGVPIDTEAEILTNAWEPDKTQFKRTGKADWQEPYTDSEGRDRWRTTSARV